MRELHPVCFTDNRSPANGIARNRPLFRKMTSGARVMAFYEKVIKVKADVAAYLINCFPSA
jgi:hypothetical protein